MIQHFFTVAAVIAHSSTAVADLTFYGVGQPVRRVV